jgi:ubiquinone/menaquinone biosynthesis C-methylase UbiE
MFRNISISEVIFYILERKLRLRLPINSKKRWKANVGSEIRFWNNCFKTNGLIWPDEFKLRFDPSLELQKEIIPLLPNSDIIYILDVGAGPLTFLGKKYKNKKLIITAIDPLADAYDKILQKYSVRPLIRTIKLNAEDLTKKFNENSFDLVVARNSIDHSFSPIKALNEMFKVVKKDRYIFMIHKPNEAINEKWAGLHQWNFSENKGDFMISSKNSNYNFSKEYQKKCNVTCKLNISDGMLYTYILKKES